MIRVLLTAFLALVLGNAGPAFAQEQGVVATYEGDGQRVVIEAAGASVRMEVLVPESAPQMDLIMDPAGEIFVVLPEGLGGKAAQRITVRASDVAAMLAAELGPMLRTTFSGPNSPFAQMSGFRLEAEGEETVGGVTGTRFGLAMPNAPEGMEPFPGLVVTSASDFAPIIRFGDRFLALLEAVFPLEELLPGELGRSLNQLRGTAVLRFGGHRLTSFDRRAIDRSRFALPSDPLSREELKSLFQQVTRTPDTSTAPDE